MTKDEQWLLDEKYHGQATAEFEIDRQRLACGEPLAYMIGWQPFLGMKIYLDSHPLIPRPETEWWTEEMLRTMNEWSGLPSAARTGDPRTFAGDAHELRFLDLCAGSGAIGCAVLKSLPYMEVFFGEIDGAHEQTIVKNIRENKLDLPAGRQARRAHIGIGDLFEPFGDTTFDIIAANPPYVPSDRSLPASVADYEPALALFAGSDGLDLIRRIARELPKRLNKGGQAWVECDRGHAEATKELFTKQGFKAEIRNDQYQTPRFVVISYPL